MKKKILALLVCASLVLGCGKQLQSSETLKTQQGAGTKALDNVSPDGKSHDNSEGLGTSEENAGIVANYFTPFWNGCCTHKLIVETS